MKVVVAAFNWEKALVGAFSVITNLRMDFFGALILRLLSVQQAAAHLSRRLRRERRSCFPIMLAELIIFSLLITSRTCIPDMEQNQSNFTNYIYPPLHTNSTSHGVAPECGEVSAEPVPHLLAADHRAHREPVTQALDSIDM